MFRKKNLHDLKQNIFTQFNWVIDGPRHPPWHSWLAGYLSFFAPPRIYGGRKPQFEQSDATAGRNGQFGWRADDVEVPPWPATLPWRSMNL